MGTSDRATDSFAAGGLGARLDLATGRILCAMTKYGDEIVGKHPFTQKTLAGWEVPFAKEVFAICKTAHDALATQDERRLPLIGFDVAFCDDGFVFLEANCPSILNLQKMDTPYGADKRYAHCIQSHLALVNGYSRLSPDPVVRREQAG